MPEATAPESVLLDDWHVVADRSCLKPGRLFRTKLFGIALEIAIGASGETDIRRLDGKKPVHSAVKYGLV